MSELWKLPTTWCWIPIGDATDVIGGGTPSTTNPKNFEGSIPWITPADMSGYSNKTISGGTRFISEKGLDDSGARWLPQGTVLFSSRAPIGYVAIASRPVTTNQGFKSFVPECGLNSDYLYYWLTSAKQHAEALASGTTFLELSGAKAALIPLPLAPAAEQTRIVAKLEELLSDLDAGVAELKAAQKKLGQYRQSLLKAAVEGALTAEWRKQQQAPLSPRGRGAGGEGANTPETDTWFRDRARELRKAQTPAEHDLWQQLRAKRFSGFKFRRQQVIGNCIVDFVCFDQKLVIELDGSQHAEAKERDESRDRWLSEQGFRVLRFWNNEWMAQTESVLETIWSALHKQPPLPNPSPTRGEGLNAPFSVDGLGGASETGAQLLARILTERRARWEAKQLAKFKEQGKTPPKDWQAKYPEPVRPDTTDLPELPEGWVWASVEQIASDERYSLSIGPFGSNLKVPDYRETGVPLVFVRNIRSGNYGGAYTKYVTPEKAEELSAHSITAGDVLITKMGEPPGDADVYPDDQPPAIITADCIKVRCWAGLMRPDFLKTVINSYIGQRQIEPMTQGVAQKKVSLGRFTSLAVPIPSIQEQDWLMSMVSVANGEAVAQEAAIAFSLKQSTAQRQNILRAAFAGQLVPQDPNDEPASVLLERIRAERAARNAVKKLHGRKVEGRS